LNRPRTDQAIKTCFTNQEDAFFLAFTIQVEQMVYVGVISG
jgi:hypothetical protein